MWYHTDLLNAMVSEYDKCDLVKQVLIINNRDEGKIELNSDKVVIIGNGNNIFVNPAWNLGVKEATTEKVILANDDIWIKGVCTLLYIMNAALSESKVVGLSPQSFGMNGGSLNSDKVTGISYGFGVFMGICKQSYKVIPKEFKVWYGDAIQWRHNTPITLTHGIYTKMRGTSAKLNLSKERKEERIAWRNYIK